MTARNWTIFWIAILCPIIPSVCPADATTQPIVSPKTGAFDVTFTDRSPQSTPAELARRLNLQPQAVADDYILAQRPYKIYVPTNYDPQTPCGIFVYLNYKDSVSTPPLWNSILDQSHLIFITPVCHTGVHYPNSVPLWQSVGLALDAVYNLKQQYAVDDHRIYMMSITDGGMQAAMALADTFTGFIVGNDYQYFGVIITPQGAILPPTIHPPPDDLLALARRRAYFLADDGSAATVMGLRLIVAAMQKNGFDRVSQSSLDFVSDLHYPNFTTAWLRENALPFLDYVPAATPMPATSQPASPAGQMLDMARLDIANGQTDLAKTKLQELIDTYPDDPAAAQAKDLLQQLNNQ
jgi:hypothetical protein